MPKVLASTLIERPPLGVSVTSGPDRPSRPAVPDHDRARTVTARHPRSDPGDDLVVDGVARRGPVGRGRFAATAVAEDEHLVPRRHRLTSDVDHELVHRNPPRDAELPAVDPHCGTRTGRTRDAVAVTERNQRERGRLRRPIGQVVRNARSGRALSWSARHAPAASSPVAGRGLGAGRRVEPVQADPTPHQRRSGPPAWSSAAAVFARCSTCGRSPGVGGDPDRIPERGQLLVDARVAGHVGTREVRHQPGDPHRAGRLRAGGRRRPAQRQLGGGAHRRGPGRCRP